MRKKLAACVLALAGTAIAAPAYASLTTFQQYNGSYGVSTDGFGSVLQNGTISASVPVGSTVVAAYFYTSLYSSLGSVAPGTTLNGTAVSFIALPLNGPSCCALQAFRSDVTSIVAPVIDGGLGGVYNFTVHESVDNQDGEALVVVYTNPLLPAQTVGILDGFSASSGDNSAINFSTPLHPGDAGFVANMWIGDGFSYDTFSAHCDADGFQVSTIKVNGTTMTNQAGCNDDSFDSSDANGNLITVGSFDDPFSPLLPSVGQDHEAYDLRSFITDGDLSININTNNPSNDDNIFLEVFLTSGLGGLNTPPPDATSVPEPMSLVLFGSGLVALAGVRRKRRQ